MGLTGEERQVLDAIAAGREELVELAGTLIGFDTTARSPGDPPRQEAELQRYLASRLAAVEAKIDLFEPDAVALQGQPLVPPGLEFAGRPQLIATRRGTGRGRSLVLNGHIDAVSVEPREAWTSDPFAAEVRDGNLYGRGACDMKGGIAAMVFAVETLASLGFELAGDVVIATNTDEESSGAGGTALVHRGLTADAGIVTEATEFDTWVGCRGSDYGVVRVAGRPGHAEVHQPDWHHGGAVNAIERAVVVLEAIARLRRDWAARSEFEHPYLSRPSLLATMVRGGEWAVTYPASCEVTIAVMHLPGQRGVRDEVEQWIATESARDDWLRAHPPEIDWWPNAVEGFEIPVTEPIVTTMLETSRDIGRPGRISGLDSWYDGATLTKLGGIPSIAYGPPGFSRDGVSVAHTTDEYVPVDGLVACAQGIAVAAMRFCGLP
jgi:acetylornithine deacetylase